MPKRTACLMRVRQVLVGLTLSLVLGVLGSRAQTFRGAIVGNVSDQSQAPVVGAQVTVKNEATGIARTTVTGAAGEYSVPELPIGTYAVNVAQHGFTSVTQAGVSVNVGAERRVDVILTPAMVQSTVEVRAQIPLVETTTNVLGGTIEASQIANTPVNGRDYTKLIFLNPGVSGSPDQITDSPGSFGEFSVNGARGRANNFLLDGTDMNDGYRNDPTINQAGVFGTPATILPVDAVAELAVLSNFAPEYGRNAGAVINIVTKSGTNKLHGTAAEFLRNNALDARNFFNDALNGVVPPKTSFHNNQFGGSLGGPIIRDKTFFFTDYEGQRETGGLNSLSCVPSPGNIAAASHGITVNPVITALLARNPWPAPNSGTPDSCATGGNLSATTSIFNSVNSVIGKIDHNINDTNLITGRYYYGTSIQSFPLGLQGGGLLPGYNTETPTNINLISLSYLHTLSATQVNELRAGFNRFAETFFPQDHSFDPTSIGLDTVTNKQDFGLPTIVVSGFAPIGGNTSLPRGRVDYNYQLIDDFSWKLNRHDLKFGYEFRRTPVTQFFDESYRGKLSFGSLTNFLEGMPSSGRQAVGNSYRSTAQNSHALYAQDSFRWNRELTLNLGVRWDYFGVIHEKHNLFSNFDPVNGLRLVGTNGLSSLYQPDYKNFAPRVSVAYDLGGRSKTVVRVGWGIFYDLFSQDFFLGQLPFNTFNPGPAYNGIGPDPILFSFSPASQIVAGQPVFSGFGATDVFAVDRNIRTPYMENYNLNIQQQLGSSAVLQVSYVGSEGHRLFRYRDINQVRDPAADCTNSPEALRLSCVHPFDNGPFPPATSGAAPTFGYVNYFESSANSNYNALQTTLRLREYKGLQTTVNYTWGHSIDNASDGQDFVANATQPDNSFNPAGEKGNSNFDVRNRFVAMWNYAFPVRKGSWSRLTDGWGVSSTLTLQSGQPFNLNLFDNYNGSGEFFPRPDVVGNPYAGTSSPNNFVNLTSFAVPCTFYPGAVPPGSSGFANACDPTTLHFGSMGRNSLIGPPYKQWDVSFYKDTVITEQVKMQIRAEFYNILNHPNFASPLYPGFSAAADYNGIDSTGHGIGFFPLTETGDVGVGNPFLGGGGPRGIQLALKLSF